MVPAPHLSYGDEPQVLLAEPTVGSGTGFEINTSGLKTMDVVVGSDGNHIIWPVRTRNSILNAEVVAIRGAD